MDDLRILQAAAGRHDHSDSVDSPILVSGQLSAGAEHRRNHIDELPLPAGLLKFHQGGGDQHGDFRGHGGDGGLCLCEAQVPGQQIPVSALSVKILSHVLTLLITCGTVSQNSIFFCVGRKFNHC